MFLSIRTKLFLTLLTASAVTVLGMQAFMRWSFNNGLVELAEERQRERISQISARLEQRYREDGGWQRLSQDGRLWIAALLGDVGRRWREEEAEVVYVGIDPEQGNWSLTPSFPIFWANVVAGGGALPGEFASVGLLDEAETMAVGEEIPLPAGLLDAAASGPRIALARPLMGWLAVVGLVLVAVHGWATARRRI